MKVYYSPRMDSFALATEISIEVKSIEWVPTLNPAFLLEAAGWVYICDL